MGRKTEPIQRTPNRQQLDNMTDVLEQMESSGSIYFMKALTKTAVHNPKVKQTAKLHLPRQFVEEISDKVEEFVTLRVRTSTGTSTQSWPVRCLVAASLKVSIVAGWTAFVVDNHLKVGDFVVFVLREDARSEFEVHVFRGPRAFPYFPDQGERSDEEDEDEEEEEENDSSDSEKEEKSNNLASPVHQQGEHNQDVRRDIREAEGNLAPLQPTGNPPRFSKRLMASNVGLSSGKLKPAQFEFPNRFIRAHGEHVHDTIKLQGIHEDSRNYVMACRRRPRNLFKVYFAPCDWSRFVRDNDLKEGQELEFSLMDDSYFLVRIIS